MSNDVIEQLRRYLDYAAEASAEESISAGSAATSSGVKWWRRGPVVAAIVAMLVLVAALPVLLLGSGSQPPVGSELPQALEVGVNHVWPEAGFNGGPEEIAEEFARLALGWIEVETIADPEAAADGPVWVTIQHPGNHDLRMLTAPLGGGRRVLVQVGSAVRITTGLNADEAGQWIGIPPNLGAESAFLHVRFVDPDRVEVIRAEEDDLARRRVEITSDSRIGGVVVVYLDDEGRPFTAVGGHFGPFDDAQDPDTSGEITYTTYVDTEESVWIESDCPNTDQLLKGNPDGLPHISSVQTKEEIEAWRGTNEDSRIIPRNGEVWERTPAGEIVVTQVEDYMIEVTLDDVSRCPGLPTSTNGIQVIYRISND
jgi:hypothetical protein